MSQPSPPLAQRIALAMGLILLLVGGPLRVVAEPNDIKWSISTPPVEAGPRSFLAIALHLHNQSASAQTLRLHFNVSPLRSLNGNNLEVALRASEEKTVLYTLYVPPDAPGGSEVPVSAHAEDGTLRKTAIRISAVPGCKATADSVDTRFVRPQEKAIYEIKIANIGNLPLNCTIHPTTSPQTARTTVTPEKLLVPVGETAGATVEVETGDIADFTTFVTSAEINTAELSGDAARQFLYFHTEAFPLPAPPDRTQLFETIKGSLLVGVGSGMGNQNGRGGADGVVREGLTLEGLISENTRFQFVEAFTHPSQGDGDQSSALSALPGSSSRNYFHLGLYNPYFDLEAGEITTAPARLLSSRETGDGFRTAVRPTGKDNLQIEAFAEENTLTLNRKDVFGATISGTLSNSPLEFWRVGTLSKRGDIGPQGSNWDTAGFDTGWRIPLTIPLRAEISAAAGENSSGHSGGAWLAGLHYNRIVPGETDTSPFKAGIEFASGDKGFPGTQNGRDDRRAYASFRFSTTPTYIEAYADYNDSNYKVVPNIEKTLAEEQNLVPDFLLTSQSRLIDAGLRWKTLVAIPGAWRLPSGNAEFQETSYFNKSNFFDQANERAVAINLQPFDRPAGIPGGTDWQLNLLTRSGTETHESGGGPKTDSQFFTFGTDFNFTRAAPEFLEKIGGAGRLNAEFSGRYTVNLDGDRQALNRTGVSITTATSWLTDTWSVQAGTTFYSYEGQSISDRVWASLSRKISKGWWAGIQAAYTHRGDAVDSGSNRRNETAALLTFRHDFEIPVPWLPRSGQAVGQIFNDLNNNGRRDFDEAGLEGVKIAVGRSQALTGPKGEFSFPPVTAGNYPVVITPPNDDHFNQSAGHPVEKTVLTKGRITQLAVGLTKPTACEGQIRFVREHSETDVAVSDKPEDLSGFEIVSIDSKGITQRSATRADGFFAIYLDPGTYDIQVNPTTLKAQQSVSPASLTVKVKRARIENLAFTVTERPKRIRKTFTAKKS